MRLSKKLIAKAQKLSPGEKVELALLIFNTEVETDNYEQIVIYTGTRYISSSNDRIRNMKDGDFE